MRALNCIKCAQNERKIQMKKMKKILALALVIVSVLAIAAPALAEAWSSRYGDIELYTNSGDNHDIMRMQTDLNKYFKNIPAHQLTVDGYFGKDTKATVIEFQRRMGLTQDGRVGPNTKDKLWQVYQGEISSPLS